jgi:hypothetical protein
MKIISLGKLFKGSFRVDACENPINLMLLSI